MKTTNVRVLLSDTPVAWLDAYIDVEGRRALKERALHHINEKLGTHSSGLDAVTHAIRRKQIQRPADRAIFPIADRRSTPSTNAPLFAVGGFALTMDDDAVAR